MKILYLSIKKEYFDKIKSGEKKYEYRLCKPYWATRLVGRGYDLIQISNGYPKKGDQSRIIERPFKGYKVVKIKHKEFGGITKNVYAIRVN